MKAHVELSVSTIYEKLRELMDQSNLIVSIDVEIEREILKDIWLTYEFELSRL